MNAPSFRFYQPAEKLRRYIDSYSFTEIESGTPLRALLVPEWAKIRFVLSGHWTARVGDVEGSSDNIPVPLFGPTSRACLIAGTPPTRAVGVGLLPLGWVRLIGQPAHLFANRIVPLHEIFPHDANRLLQALRSAADEPAMWAILDEFFLNIVARRAEPPPTVVRAHQVLLDPTIGTAEQFATALSLSSRHTARLSLDMFGFAPKLLLRRQRLLRTIGRMSANLDTPWTAQLDESYADQPHFVREFREFMGIAPMEYFALQRYLFDQVTRSRQQAIGEPLQGLHQPARSAESRS